MRIGINTLFWIPEEVGGTETYLLQTLHAMRRMAVDDFIVCFTNQENDDVLREAFADDSGVSCRKIDVKASYRGARILAEQLSLPARVHGQEIDVLWSPGYTAPIRLSCKQVVTIHDVQYKRYPQDLSPLSRLATDFLVRRAAQRSDGILAVSEFTKSEIVSCYGVPRERIAVTYEAAAAVFSENIRPDDLNQIRRRLLRRDDVPFILCVAHTYPHKRVDLLVEAFSALQTSIPHDLVLVGKGRRGERDLQCALSRVQDQARVHRLSGLSAMELAGMYKSASCFVLPSLYEGFGLPILEAMSAGTPVITTRHGSIPEVAGDGAIYSEGSDAGELARSIRTVLGWDAAERNRWIARGRAQADRFSWDRTALGTIEFLRKVAH